MLTSNANIMFCSTSLERWLIWLPNWEVPSCVPEY
uniref:Uncharacterized protein n=1 Tax=Arundo donax TaxID=35708 RepID=A0A0A9AP88_ARUDO